MIIKPNFNILDYTTDKCANVTFEFPFSKNQVECNIIMQVFIGNDSIDMDLVELTNFKFLGFEIKGNLRDFFKNQEQFGIDIQKMIDEYIVGLVIEREPLCL